MPEIGDIFYAEYTPERFLDEENRYEPSHAVCGVVTSIHWPLLSWTPIYDPRHKKEYFVTNVPAFLAGKRMYEVEQDEHAAMQAAEIAAEMAVPQWMVW